MLTIKSDDINGRSQAYESIVKGKRMKRPNMPESFNVLLRELQALNLKMDLLDKETMEAEQAEQLERYSELEKLEGQFDIEVDTQDFDRTTEDVVTSGTPADEEV